MGKPTVRFTLVRLLPVLQLTGKLNLFVVLSILAYIDSHEHIYYGLSFDLLSLDYMDINCLILSSNIQND